MAYLALYRKYRPKVFEEVVGQSHITETIINQIKSNRLSHAYLFSGPRGTGKTSSAKIISRYVNCLNPKGHNPCNDCESCKQILADSFLDVIEMDAASNNGVDDIRGLTEGLRYPPSSGKKKVIIIDEVHMLSKGAFNALLKTLEEPPHYVIFILATTEPEKIPQTILSRCQRFDFKRISKDSMLNFLGDLSKLEGINITEDALSVIAKLSGGAMRDALSLLEKLASIQKDKIDAATIDEVIGDAEEDLQLLISALMRADISEVLKISESIYYSGKDIRIVIENLIELLRKGLLYSSGISHKISEIKRSELEFFEKIEAKGKEAFFIYAIGEFIEASKLKLFDNVRASFEYTLASICAKPGSKSVGALESRIIALEERLKRIEAGDCAVNSVQSDAALGDSSFRGLQQAQVQEAQIKEAQVKEAETRADEVCSSEAPVPDEMPASDESPLFNHALVGDEPPAPNQSEAPQQALVEQSKDEAETGEITFGSKSWQEVLQIVKDKNTFAANLICKIEPISFDGTLFKGRFQQNFKTLASRFESGGLNIILNESIRKALGGELNEDDISIKIID